MRESDEEAALLGRIAVRQGFITMEQLAEATRERGRVGKKLGAIMLERGMLDELQLGKVLALQQRHRDALRSKKKATKKRVTARERIATPKDWAFEAPRSERTPRRERRTRDVVRDHLKRESADPRRPQPIPPPRERKPAPEPAADEPAEPEERSETKAQSDDGWRRRPTAPELPRSERPTPPSGVPATTVPKAAPLPRDEPSGKAVPGKATRDTAPQTPAARSEPPDSGGDALIVDIPRQGEAPRVSLPPAPFADLEPLPWDVPTPENPRVAFLFELLTHAVESRASDVHIHAGAVARMRHLGELVPMTDEPLAAEATLQALTAILTPWQRRVFEEAGEIDFAYEVEGLSRFRANVYRQHNGTNGVFHVIPSSVPSLTSLRLPESLATLTNYTQGLILITGPAGCGKTSTMAALTNIINEERTDHILTIEDPIEYVFESKRCIINQRQVGRHTESFARGLRGALREDPDIICIGELRDLETISLALSAAETGHLVLATVHTGSAIGTINRIVGAYPPSQQAQVRAMMSESLRAITSQRLLAGTDGNCHVALETLFITRAVGALIRDNRTFQIGSIMQTGRAQGMRLLDDSLRELLESKLIDQDVALANCNDPRRLGGN